MHSDPLAYFFTWTGYGTWLPGDDSGWTIWQKGKKIPQPWHAGWLKERLTEESIVLDEQQRAIVEDTVAKHGNIRGGNLHSVNCRSNHSHIVITAKSHKGEQICDQLKAWSIRKLKMSKACVVPLTLKRKSPPATRHATSGGLEKVAFDTCMMRSR